METRGDDSNGGAERKPSPKPKRYRWRGPDGYRKRNGTKRAKQRQRTATFAHRFWSGRVLFNTPWDDVRSA